MYARVGPGSPEKNGLKTTVFSKRGPHYLAKLAYFERSIKASRMMRFIAYPRTFDGREHVTTKNQGAQLALELVFIPSRPSNAIRVFFYQAN